MSSSLVNDLRALAARWQSSSMLRGVQSMETPDLEETNKTRKLAKTRTRNIGFYAYD